MTSPLALLRRHEWKNLSEPERDAVADCMSIAGMRVAVGVGMVLTGAAMIGQARRGKPPLPPGLRYGAVGFFSLLGGYAGFLSAGPIYARRILSVPNSPLADDLRIVAGDWQQRTPDFSISASEFAAAKEAQNNSLAPPPPQKQ